MTLPGIMIPVPEFNKNNWSTVSGVNEGATYQLSRLYKKWGISSVNELMKKFTGNWITGTYSYNGVTRYGTRR